MTRFRYAAIYARVSTEKQSQLSTVDQIRKCRDYAESHGLCVLNEHIYVDEAVSGMGTDRPALNQLLDVVSSPVRPFDAILVDDSSRLSRNLADAKRLFERLNFHNVQLIAVSQGIDSQDKQAGVLMTVHGLVDELYIQELAEKTHRGLEGLFQRGLHTGGRIFGYVTVMAEGGRGKQLVVSDAEAAVVRRIFEMSAGGFSLKTIAKTLNREGIKPPRPRAGKRYATWCPTAIQTMLKRELYVGRAIWNRSQFVKVPGTNRRIRRPRSKNDWHVIERPDLAIVSREVWQQVQDRFARLTNTYGKQGREGLLPRSATGRYLFSGL